MIDKIHDMVLRERRIKVNEIVEATGISQGTVFQFCTKNWVWKKSWQDRCRVCSQRRINAIVWSTEAISELFRRNPDEFLRRYITVDKTWIHHYTLETKKQSKQWVWRWMGSGEGEDGEIGRQGDGHGFLGCTRNHLHRLLGKRTNDNWSVLCVVIAPVERRNREKTSSLKKKKILFHEDNARVHTCAVLMAKLWN